MPLACYMCGALGLTFGTFFDPRTVPILFGIVVLPLTFLGAVVLLVVVARARSSGLQILMLANPLVYMCEGFRAALTTVPHMSLWAIYPAMIGFSVLFTWLGVRNFKRRVALRSRADGWVTFDLCPGATQVTFWGVRGSTPCDGHQFDRYGGTPRASQIGAPGPPAR